MQAIEFETILQKGCLKVPDSCSSWEGQLVRVIVLSPGVQEMVSTSTKTNIALSKLAGIAQGTGESVAEKHDDYLYSTTK